MSIVAVEPQVLHLGPLKQKMSDDEYFDFCQRNSDWRIEQSCDGEIIIMPLTGGETGRINAQLNGSFGNWAKADGTGIAFDSSTEFILPNTAKRSPDLSWVKRALGCADERAARKISATVSRFCGRTALAL